MEEGGKRESHTRARNSREPAEFVLTRRGRLKRGERVIEDSFEERGMGVKTQKKLTHGNKRVEHVKDETAWGKKFETC